MPQPAQHLVPANARARHDDNVRRSPRLPACLRRLLCRRPAVDSRLCRCQTQPTINLGHRAGRNKATTPGIGRHRVSTGAGLQIPPVLGLAIPTIVRRRRTVPDTADLRCGPSSDFSARAVGHRPLLGPSALSLEPCADRLDLLHGSDSGRGVGFDCVVGQSSRSRLLLAIGGACH